MYIYIYISHDIVHVQPIFFYQWECRILKLELEIIRVHGEAAQLMGMVSSYDWEFTSFSMRTIYK